MTRKTIKLCNLYARLGLVRSATHAEIKKAYYMLSMIYHPDKNDGCQSSALKFREITEAYEILANPQTRQQYDRGSPSDGHKRAEMKTSGPKPPRTYAWASEFDERDPEFEVKIRFYQQYGRQKSKPPTSSYRQSRPYDFDAWFSAHYGTTFGNGWYGDEKNGKSTSDWQDFGQTEAFKFNQNKSVRPPQEAPKNSPFDFNHIYTNPIEYTIKKHKSEKIIGVIHIVVIIFILLGIAVSAAFIIANATFDQQIVSENIADTKKINSVNKNKKT